MKFDPGQEYVVTQRAPEYEIRSTDSGLMYAAYRPAEAGQLYWRAAHFLLPFWTMPPINELSTNVLTRARYSHPVDRSTGLICDQTIALTGFTRAKTSTRHCAESSSKTPRPANGGCF